ncbi:MAG: hypothetical protein CVV44_13610 [Spirochaetae bacterium HGW-Spirochaetae-1]|jgi:acyl-CoA synthetase (AMP-forming)/AMP-acid ligase II|nr:MAG: hypothetical protein CVV44_13610 [Spirochaetae bacterium HGW-Spirochaetae-1]
MYTLGDLTRNGAQFFPDKTAIVFEDTRLTYREFNNRVNRFANALVKMGFKKGDRLCVLADNCSKYLEVYFGAAKIGICVTPINHRLGDQELVYIINHCESTLLVVGDGFEERVSKMKEELKNIKKWITIDNSVDGFANYEEFLLNSSDAEPDTDVYSVQEEDLAVLMYTGGTTGLPKGVMLNHRSCMLAGLTSALAMEFTRNDSTCYVLPIFHVSWWPILAIFMVSGKVCINRKPNLGKIFELIQNEKCTHINLVPTIYGWMVDNSDVDKYDLSSLRVCSYAGSPFPTEVLKKCIQKFGNKFCQGYGATETAGAAISMLAMEDHFLQGPKSKYLVSAGKPSPCSRIKIVDDKNNILKPGEMGEICAKGKHIMMGYWKNEEANRSSLIDGWYHTGDIGYIDRDGYIFMTDRKADMIISGGENVYPGEVENVIYQHPSVSECSVVSAPDAKWGEIVQAVVVLKPGAKATEEEIIDHCRNTLAGYKCPKAVAFWDSIPKTIIGKIIKKEIKAKFWKGKERVIS